MTALAGPGYDYSDRLLGKNGRPWMEHPHFLLCSRTGRKAKRNGNCPVHGGDACLFIYVQVSSMERP